ncbi:Glycosyl transferase family 2 [Pseudobutyrivibrio ruminis]|uniref:Glycosyl transferase family 2 n=1 Tax=Pseudobutyrivibrio ruminis TaxID=46206 RepID=A0A1H7H584_9FIRM|nr:glycosyltransferase family 2 protein [Pseudobutyrivibrio ruminis]SEK45556.1 Glycosyl transferase family 2 [Pseudobutyrivibrio ruminis]
MGKKLVSVIVPVYNAEKYIDRCINSILNQSYKSIELVLVDDGSQDKSMSICKKYECYDNVVIITQANAGAAAARNKGLEVAKGDYVIFVDSDDWIESSHIYNMINAINDNGQLVICGYKEIYHNKEIVKSPKNKTYKKESFYKFIDRWGLDPIVGSPCNKLIERKCIIDNAVLFPRGRKYAEDFSFNIELLNYYNSIVTIDSCTYNYDKSIEGSLSKINFDNLKHWWIEEKKVYYQLVDSEYLNGHKGTINGIFAYLIGANLVFQIRNNEIDREFLHEVKEKYKEVLYKIKVNSTFKMNICYQLEKIYILNYYNSIGNICLWFLKRICI